MCREFETATKLPSTSVLVAIMILSILGAQMLTVPSAIASLTLEGSAQTNDAAQQRAIVGFSPSIPSNLDAILARHGGSKVSINYALRFVVLTVGNIDQFMQGMKMEANVRYVEPDIVVHATAFPPTPNDPGFSSQWGPQDIYAPQAWGITVGSRSVTVAIIDTGVDYTHPDLSPNIWTAPDGSHGWNFAVSFGSGNNNPRDDSGHGTHVAGIAAAVINNGVGIAGVSGSSIMAVKVLDSSGNGYISWVASGIQWATDHGAKIISMSLGASSSSSTLQNAVNYAWGKGSVLVAAAGNDNQQANSVDYPAAYPNVIAVSALSQGDTIASYSSIGPQVDLSAPGTSIYSTMPTYQVYLNTRYGYPMNYASLSGTSMATPHVSGTAALVWARSPALTNTQVTQILTNNAFDLGPLGQDVQYGYGKVDAYNSVLAATPSPDFTFSLSAGSITIIKPGQGTLGITTQSLNGFNSPVTYNLQALPGGVTYSFDVNPVTPPADGVTTSQLTLSVDSSASSGTYSLSIVGSAGTLTHQTSFTLTIPSPPSAPTGLKASAGNAYVTLTWSPPSSDGGSSITGYNVYRGTSSGGEDPTPIITLAASVQTYKDSGLTNGVKYYYQLTATNAVGESARSSEVSATPTSTPALSVTVATDKSTYTRGFYTTVSITVTVKSNGSPVRGASVSITVYYPNGSVARTASATTNSNGQASFRYTLYSSSPRGTYKISAQASMTGYTAGTASTTFNVQ